MCKVLNMKLKIFVTISYISVKRAGMSEDTILRVNLYMDK
jgi:hypothetical protein